MQLKCATFDEIVAAGAKYHSRSRGAEPPLRIPQRQIVDSPDDFVVLDDAVLTPEVGIAWHGYWVAHSIQYLGPGHEWEAASWLPGKYDPITNTIDIDSVNLQAKASYDQPLFFIDTTIGKENFAHFIFDTLPYGMLFQKVRPSIPTLVPLVRPFEFPHQEPLFDAVFDFRYKDSVCYGGGLPTRIAHLVLPRRQTDFEGSSWRLSFAGIRHIRDVALRRWARAPRRAETQAIVRSPGFQIWPRRKQHTASREEPNIVHATTRSMDAPTEPLKIHLYRVQDVDALRRAGNLRGRNFANLDAFCHLLLARGYVVFEPGQTPLEFLVDALSRAGVIVGIHGAGLANFVFSPPGTRIYEITGEDDTWRFLEAASAVLGHDFTRVRQSGSPDPEKPSLNIAQLARALP